MVFQLLVKPGSYTAGRETVGFGDRQIDKEFKNSQIEWSTKQISATILYGLLIKAEEDNMLLNCITLHVSSVITSVAMHAGFVLFLYS